MTALVLIRHGQTTWNQEGRYSGQTDIPLSEEGLRQAQHLAERLRGQSFQAIYSSDLQRARQTAEPIARATGAPLYFDPRLREINQGEWEGMLFEDIRRRFLDLWQHRLQNPHTAAPPGGETVGQVRERVLGALEEILQAHPQGRVAIVAHGLVLALILTHAQGEPLERVWDRIPDNAEPHTVHLEAA